MSNDILKKPEHSNANLVDMFIIGFCILGDKVLHINLLVYCLGVYLTYRILLKSPDYTFALLIALIPNLAVMSITIIGLSVPMMNLLIGLALMKVVFIYRKKTIGKGYLLLIGLMIGYEWLHVFYYQFQSIILLVSWSFAVLYVSLYFITSVKTYDHKIVIKYYITGVFISVIYGILDFYGEYGTLMTNNSTIRFKGGAGDPNYFSMYIMISLFIMLHLVYKNSNKFYMLFYSLLFVFFVAFGLLSLSRMFLIVIIFLSSLLILKIFLEILKYKKYILFIFYISCVIVLFSFFFLDEFNSIFHLLFSRFTDFIDDPAALTSNRNILAEQYIQLLMKNPRDMIFGMGIQEYYLRSGAIQLEAHNIVLEILVVWGLVGYFIFIMFLATLLKNGNGKSRRINNNLISWLPIICMGISYMSINAMSNESFYLLLLFSIKNIHEFDL